MGFFEKLYNGAICPAGEGTPTNEVFREAMNVTHETSKALDATFSETQKELWEKHEQAQIEIEDQLHIQCFRQGFLVGVEMMHEIYGKDCLQDSK